MSCYIVTIKLFKEKLLKIFHFFLLVGTKKRHFFKKIKELDLNGDEIAISEGLMNSGIKRYILA